jgi:hypothetical protein
MRSFQPIYRASEDRQTTRWTPPRGLRWAAVGFSLCAFALILSYGWQIERYTFNVQRDPASAASRKWPKSIVPVELTSLMLIACAPFAAPRRRPAKQKHRPDPALSIFPR